MPRLSSVALGSAIVCLLIVAQLGGAGLSSVRVAGGGPSRPLGPTTTPTAGPSALAFPLATVTLGDPGIDPTVASFEWTQDTAFDFSNYTLADSSGSSGPWTNVAVISTAGQDYELIYGLTPGGSLYWQVTDLDCYFRCTSTT
jgi:hypothetical protein